MLTHPVRYQSDDEDSARWEGFEFRPGDIVISTRSKSGTTWMQMICALLIFQSPELPAPLGRLSPWLDWLITPRDEVFARLAAHEHRRIIKTHTPLDGLPLDPRATYIVVGRHPLDMAVSLYHQGNNINRERVRELTGRPAPTGQADAAGPANAACPAEPAEPAPPRPQPREWLLQWIDSGAGPPQALDSLRGVMHHLSDAWARRTVSSAALLSTGGAGDVRRRGPGGGLPGGDLPGADPPEVILVHYDDLRADLDGQMRWLARLLGISVPADLWPPLVRAATFEEMRARAAAQAPDDSGVLKDPAAFFRRGRSGAGRELLTTPELAHYHARAALLAAPDLLGWLHRPPG